MVVISTPCQDLSSANVNGTSLAGSESKLLWDALRILDIVKVINPDVKYIIERVWFEEKFPLAYAAVNEHIGTSRWHGMPAKARRPTASDTFGQTWSTNK
jgi:hypothetical protein